MISTLKMYHHIEKTFKKIGSTMTHLLINNAKEYIGSQFHQLCTHSFYTRKSQKCKNTDDDLTLFLRFWDLFV